MARRTAFGVTIDVSEIEGLADKLKGLTPEAVGALMVDAINEVTDRTYLLARKTMLGGINLTDAYVQQKMQVVHATPAKPEASIVAFGDKANLTNLSHYGAIQLSKDGGKRGDTARGIAPGRRQAGISVEVIKGKRETFQFGFTRPGINDNDGNPIIFARKKETKKIVSRRGPAVYMLFRVAAGVIENQVYGDLERAVIDEAERQFQKEFS